MGLGEIDDLEQPGPECVHAGALGRTDPVHILETQLARSCQFDFTVANFGTTDLVQLGGHHGMGQLAVADPVQHLYVELGWTNFAIHEYADLAE